MTNEVESDGKVKRRHRLQWVATVTVSAVLFLGVVLVVVALTVEFGLCHERFVPARAPVVAVTDVAALHPVEEDLTDGGELDPGAFLDGPVREPVDSGRFRCSEHGRSVA